MALTDSLTGVAGRPVDLAQYRSLRRRGTTIARSFRLSPADAEDVVQEALIRMMRVPDEGTPHRYEAYFDSTVRHLCIDLLRKRSREAELPEPDELPGQTRSEKHEQRLLVREVLAGMPESARGILVRNHIEGHTVTEISQELGVSANACSAMLYRARRTFRERFLRSHLLPTTNDQCERIRGLMVEAALEPGGESDEAVRAHRRSCEDCESQFVFLLGARTAAGNVLLPGALAAATATGGILTLLGIAPKGGGAGDAGGGAGGAAGGGGAVVGVAASVVAVVGLAVGGWAAVTHFMGSTPDPDAGAGPGTSATSTDPGGSSDPGSSGSDTDAPDAGTTDAPADAAADTPLPGPADVASVVAPPTTVPVTTPAVRPTPVPTSRPTTTAPTPTPTPTQPTSPASPSPRPTPPPTPTPSPTPEPSDPPALGEDELPTLDELVASGQPFTFTLNGGRYGLTAPVLSFSVEQLTSPRPLGLAPDGGPEPAEPDPVSAPRVSIMGVDAACHGVGSLTTCTLDAVGPHADVEVVVQTASSFQPQLLTIRLTDGDRPAVERVVEITPLQVTAGLLVPSGPVAAGEQIALAIDASAPLTSPEVTFTLPEGSDAAFDPGAWDEGCGPVDVRTVACRWGTLPAGRSDVVGPRVVGTTGLTPVEITLTADELTSPVTEGVDVLAEEPALVPASWTSDATFGNLPGTGRQLVLRVDNTDAEQTVEGIRMTVEVVSGAGSLALQGNPRCAVVSPTVVECATAWNQAHNGPDFGGSTLSPGLGTSITGVRWVDGAPGDVVRVTMTADNAETQAHDVVHD